MRGHIRRVMGGCAFVAAKELPNDGFLTRREFHRARRKPESEAKFKAGTWLEFRIRPDHPRPRVVEVEVLE